MLLLLLMLLLLMMMDNSEDSLTHSLTHSVALGDAFCFVFFSLHPPERGAVVLQGCREAVWRRCSVSRGAH